MPQILLVGKNLWGKTQPDRSYNANFQSLDANSFIVAVGEESSNAGYHVTFVFSLKPRTYYTFSADIHFLQFRKDSMKVCGSSCADASYYASSYFTSEYTTGGTYRLEKTFQTDATGTFKLTIFKANYGVWQAKFSHIQLEEGQKATSFEPYIEKSIVVEEGLYGIGGAYDAIDEMGNLVRVWHYLGPGQDKPYNSYSTLTNVYRILLRYQGVTLAANSFGYCVKPNLTSIPGEVSYSGDYEHHYQASSTDMYVFIVRSAIDSYAGSTTAEKIQNYLKDMAIWARLAEPQIVDLGLEMKLEPWVRHIVLPTGYVLSVRGEKCLEG